MNKPIGVLITNTGTPDSPTVKDVRRYLKAFLSDPRIVRIPRILWLPLLHLFILRSRALYSAKLYQNIWTKEGSPLKITMSKLTTKLENQLHSRLKQPLVVEYGTHYGNPSIPEAIDRLRRHDIEALIVLPLFPQYSSSTTESTFDQVNCVLKNAPKLMPIFISHYAEHPSYITALTEQIREQHQQHRHLLFSFHGLPQLFIDKGDPYAELCYKTASSIANALGLAASQWSIAYQSRFGYAKWLQPYTFEVLKELPTRGVHELSVVCPGFAVDCLETLEEIKIRGKKIFLQGGGTLFHYIPALNESDEHSQLLGDIIDLQIKSFVKR